MKTYVHLCQYLSELFFELEIFLDKVVQKIQTHILRSVAFFRIEPFMT
jgi:hypothetical protein